MAKVSTVRDQELYGFKVTLRRSNAECCSAVIVVSVDLPASVLENGHVLDVVFESSIEETVVIISQSLQLDRLISLLLAWLGTLREQQCLYFLVISIVERS